MFPHLWSCFVILFTFCATELPWFCVTVRCGAPPVVLAQKRSDFFIIGVAGIAAIGVCQS